jgi:hypothetical protein
MRAYLFNSKQLSDANMTGDNVFFFVCLLCNRLTSPERRTNNLFLLTGGAEVSCTPKGLEPLCFWKLVMYNSPSGSAVHAWAVHLAQISFLLVFFSFGTEASLVDVSFQILWIPDSPTRSRKLERKLSWKNLRYADLFWESHEWRVTGVNKIAREREREEKKIWIEDHQTQRKKGLDNVYLNVTLGAVTFDHASTRVSSNGK